MEEQRRIIKDKVRKTELAHMVKKYEKREMDKL